MKNYNIKGFTLIELLVVISIISLLSSIVLASLKTARLKSLDAAITQNVRQMANLMALEISENNNYANLNRSWVDNCSATTWTSGNYDEKMYELCLDTLTMTGGTAASLFDDLYIGSPYTNNSNRSFSIMARLPKASDDATRAAGLPVNRYVCVGANGGFSTNVNATVPTNTQGSPAPNWYGSGCWGDPSNF